MSTPSPTTEQIEFTSLTVQWYIATHYSHAAEPGFPTMFFDPDEVGHFAIDAEAFERGDADTLFKVLIATTMFQRRQDAQIIRVLKGMPSQIVDEICSMEALLALADEGECDALSSLESIKGTCDLGKDPVTKRGVCGYNSACACALKRHTVALKRYGHFGKVPTAAALAVKEAGASSLPELYEAVTARAPSPQEASVMLEQALMGGWRISDKITAMFLSMACDPCLSPGASAPWARGVDPSHFVVIDSNVDLFLAHIGYDGPKTYAKRRAFIQQIARHVDLSDFVPGVSPYQPRLVQQAMYLFMSQANRRRLDHDCSHQRPSPCIQCDARLQGACAMFKPQSLQHELPL